MEDDGRGRKVAMKRKRSRLPAGSPSPSVHDLTDDLLEVVLLGVDSPVSLVRAAATCKRWRRLVAATDGAFLHRFRSLHPPRAIGTFYSINRDTPCSYGRFHLWPEEDPVYVPSSESASDGPPSGLQLSLDFVFVPAASDADPYELADGRGSLLLLLKEKDGTKLPDPGCRCCEHRSDNIIPDLVVCEPLTRRCQAIPPPDDRVCILGAFLLDGDAGGAGGIGMTNFRVLLVLYDHDYGGRTCMDGHNGHGYPSASVFTCGGSNGGWHHGASDDGESVYLPRLDEVHLAGRTGGRIYWVCDDKQVVVLDEHTLEFSAMALPDHMMKMKWEFGRDNFRVVGGDAGTTRIVHVTGGGDLEVFGQHHGCHGTDDWMLEMKVQVIEASRGLRGHKEKYFATGAKIIDAEEGSVVLSPDKKTWLFSVDLETMELKREYRRKKYTGPAFPYTLPWPPGMRAFFLLRAPGMRACVENDRKRREGEREDERNLQAN